MKRREISWYASPIPAVVQVKEVRSWGLSPSVPCGWQEPIWSPHQYLPRTCVSRKLDKSWRPESTPGTSTLRGSLLTRLLGKMPTLAFYFNIFA